MPEPKTYDLIVVGAGMSGIIAAARIAEKGINPRTGDRLRIALIEAGPHLLKGERKSGYGDPLRRQMIPQIIWEEMDFTMLEQWPWGSSPKVVGGASLHWGAHLFLPVDVDYGGWCAMGIDWTKENMKEAVDDVVEMFHIRPDPEEAFTKGDRLFREAARSLGYDPHPELTPRVNCIYCGFHDNAHCCKYDAKATSLWYLPIAEANGVELIDNAEVKKVILEKQGAGGIVKGVYYEKDGQIHEAQADKVVVSCNTFGSAVLLAKSGYGPRDELGNELIVENNNVGRNLDTGVWHDGIDLWFDEPIKEAGRGVNSSMQFMVEDSQYKDGTGIIRISGNLSGITYPHDAALGEFAPAFGKPHRDFMRTAVTRLGTIIVMVSRAPTHVKGRIELATGRPDYPRDPYIDRRMQEGREIAIEVIKAIQKRVGVKYSSRFPTTFSRTHPCGTCRAGSDRRNSVINQNFESHEVKGLFVVGGSSYARSCLSGGGTLAAIMGAFGARRIVENYFSRGSGI